jgi:hypothetical protein
VPLWCPPVWLALRGTPDEGRVPSGEMGLGSGLGLRFGWAWEELPTPLCQLLADAGEATWQREGEGREGRSEVVGGEGEMKPSRRCMREATPVVLVSDSLPGPIEDQAAGCRLRGGAAT